MDDIFDELLLKFSTSPVVIGINGLDCSGKTFFSNRLYEYLKSKAHDVKLLHVDDFNNMAVQDEIYASLVDGTYSDHHAELYYNKSIDYDNAANAIFSSKLLHDITIVEGVFLYKDMLAALIDLKVFLPIDPAIAKKRYISRKNKTGDQRPDDVFDKIWIPAFNRYIEEVKPLENCHVVKIANYIH